VAPARLCALSRTADAITARLTGGGHRSGALLIGADGRSSGVRALAGIPLARWSYLQVAITCALRHERDHGGRVLEFLHPAGPLALLPLGERLSAVTWTERQGDAELLLRSGPEMLHAALSGRLAGELGELELIGAPAGYPLSGQQARRLVGPRVALIGDAAHGVHPIHAQGFNLAVRDVAALAEVLVDAARAGLDPGSSETLLRYERWRQADVRFVITLTDGLNRLFSNDLAPAKLVRRLGLAAIDRLPPLKQLAIRRGMGLLGDLPRLARGEAL
jgi:2-octaprenyl-6-methoxyphenol hydroxylase